MGHTQVPPESARMEALTEIYRVGEWGECNRNKRVQKRTMYAMAAFKDEDEYFFLNSSVSFQNPPMLSDPHEFLSVGRYQVNTYRALCKTEFTVNFDPRRSL